MLLLLLTGIVIDEDGLSRFVDFDKSLIASIPEL